MVRGVRWGIGLATLAVFLGLALPGGAAAFGPLSSFGSFGEGAGELREPGNVEVGSDGSVYVADTYNHRIDVFSPGGVFLRAFGKGVSPAGGDVCTTSCRAGEEDGSAGSMKLPHDVALGAGGDVFVADFGNNRIDVFSATGEFLYAFGKNVNAGAGSSDVCTDSCQPSPPSEGAGAIYAPVGLDFGTSDTLYVTDAANRRIDVFSAAGEFLYAFGKNVDGAGGGVCTTACQKAEGSTMAGAIAYPDDVVTLPDGRIAITDTDNLRIDVFSAAGEFLYAFGKNVNTGAGDPDLCTTSCQGGELSSAAGAYDAATGLAYAPPEGLYVSDEYNNRVAQADVDGHFERAFGEGVLDGAGAFQICTVACQQGLPGTIPGATPETEGVAVDCRGAVYVTEQGAGFARVERFGEPGTPLPPCPEEQVTPPSTPVVAIPKPASNWIHIAGLRRNLRNGTAVLFVKVSAPGRVILGGRGIRRLVRGARRARQRVRLPIKPKVRLMHYLKRHRKARIRVRATFKSFDGGDAKRLEKRVVLKRRHHHRH